MSTNALYNNLSQYYDLMCVDIDYQSQSQCIQRLAQLFGNKGHNHLDLACGTGPHVQHFINFGYHCSGLDINQPMLDLAFTRCPEAHFSLQDMSTFEIAEPVDLITCFLYSMHYNQSIKKLTECIQQVYKALRKGGIFCFNLVDKDKIDNKLFVTHTAYQQENIFTFRSGWYYSGQGDKQSLKVSIEKTTVLQSQIWHDEHAMVAVSFEQIQTLLSPYFEVHLFEHDYQKLLPYKNTSGNALFTCVKR